MSDYVAPTKGRVALTGTFKQWRKTHIHAADDLAPVDPEEQIELVALKDGLLWYHSINVYRPKGSEFHAWGLVKWAYGHYPFANYRMPMYGLCAVLVTADPVQTWVYSHLDPDESNPWIEVMPQTPIWHKADNERFVTGWIAGPKPVQAGQIIGIMGNSGYTLPAGRKGIHLHCEGHHGVNWEKYPLRINLEMTNLGPWLRGLPRGEGVTL